MTIYLTNDAFSVKAKPVDKMFTSVLVLFFLLRIANKQSLFALEKSKLRHIPKSILNSAILSVCVSVQLSSLLENINNALLIKTTVQQLKPI